MRIALFSFNDELSGEGSRIISAVLKQAGHDVKMIFMPFYGSKDISYWDPELQQIADDRDAFMMSVMSCYESRAAMVTKFLKQQWPKKLVIWGGVHATALPQGCLKYADLVIRGEAESAVLEFCRRFDAGEDWSDCANLAYLDKDGNFVQNKLNALPFDEDLDAHPFPDYDLEDHWILDDGRVVRCTEELLKKFHTVYFHDVPTYFIITTRGCPFVCTYCHQSELVKTYPTREYKSRVLRYKSVQRTIDEINHQTRRFPFLTSVGFSDDDFFARHLEEIREFAPAYAKQVGKPFGAMAIASSITEEKLQLLLDAGLKVIGIGVQSGSDRVNREVYKRYLAKEKLLKAVDLLDRYHQKYDFRVDADWIIDCPWETEDDVLESINFSLKLPAWMRFNIFTLTFYPGTVIYDRALAERIIDPNDNPYEQAFNTLRKKGHSYMTYVFLLKHRARRLTSDRMVRMLASKPARVIGERIPDWFLNGVWGRKIFPKIAELCHSDANIGGGTMFA